MEGKAELGSQSSAGEAFVNFCLPTGVLPSHSRAGKVGRVWEGLGKVGRVRDGLGKVARLWEGLGKVLLGRWNLVRPREGAF